MLKEFFISLLLSGTLSTNAGTAPFWSTAGEYDVNPRSSGASSLLRMGMGYDESKTLQWRWGASLGVGTDRFNRVRPLPDEAYAGIRWKCLSLDVGLRRRERDFMAVGECLGSISTTAGNIAWSCNASTVPGYELQLHPWAVPGLDGRLRLSGRFADYWTIDNRYVRNALIHNTAFSISGDITPWWTLTLALDHYAVWGGVHPIYGRMSTSLSSYFRMLTGRPAAPGEYTGSDEINVLGNQLGRELIRLDFKGRGWTIVFQHDIPYEDKSGMKFQNFPDGVNSLCLSFDDRTLPVSAVLYEFQYTKWQGGTCERRRATAQEIASGKNPKLYREQDGSWSVIEGGADNYFNNWDYCCGWTVGGRTIGNPLFYVDGTLEGNYNPEEICLGTENNRLAAHHLGLTGMLPGKIPYRLMLTWSMNYGTYLSDRYTGVVAYGMQWKDIRQRARHQFCSGFQCEIPLCSNKLRLIPGVFWDKGEVTPECFAATLGLRYDFIK